MSTTLQGNPYQKLCALAEAKSWRVLLTQEGPVGKGQLDTLDVWEGHPRRNGKLIAREPFLGRRLEDVALAAIQQLP